MSYILLLITITFIQVNSVEKTHSTYDHPLIEQAINQLFDGMRANDRDVAAEVLYESVTLSTVVNRDGSVQLSQTDIGLFLEAVGQPKEEIWDERVSGLEVRVDGDLATAWMNYSFYRSEIFSHCGVNTMNLIRTDNDWKIFSITDTRRTEGC